jgi:hypothetical protein
MTTLIGLWTIGSVLIYAVIVEFIKSRTIPFETLAPQPFIGTLNTILYVESAAIFLLIQLINSRILASDLSLPGTNRQSSLSPETERLVTAAIATYAFCESIAIFGLAVFLLGGTSTGFYIFPMISLFFFSFYFPKYGRWEKWMKERVRSAGRIK